MTLDIFPGVTFDRDDSRVFLRQVATTVNNLLKGKVNAAVEFTPAAATTSTLVTDLRISPLSVLLIEATSAAGAVELASGAMFIDITDRGAGECTITHSVGAATELFRLIILG